MNIAGNARKLTQKLNKTDIKARLEVHIVNSLVQIIGGFLFFVYFIPKILEFYFTIADQGKKFSFSISK